MTFDCQPLEFAHSCEGQSSWGLGDHGQAGISRWNSLRRGAGNSRCANPLSPTSNAAARVGATFRKAEEKEDARSRATVPSLFAAECARRRNSVAAMGLAARSSAPCGELGIKAHGSPIKKSPFSGEGSLIFGESNIIFCFRWPARRIRRRSKCACRLRNEQICSESQRWGERAHTRAYAGAMQAHVAEGPRARQTRCLCHLPWQRGPGRAARHRPAFRNIGKEGSRPPRCPRNLQHVRLGGRCCAPGSSCASRPRRSPAELARKSRPQRSPPQWATFPTKRPQSAHKAPTKRPQRSPGRS